MSDVDQKIRRFLHDLGSKRLVSRGCLDEIESHLRDEIDDLVDGGFSVDDAFEKATKAFGKSDDLLGEYSKLYGNSRYSQLGNLLSHYFDRRTVMKVLIGIALGTAFMLIGLVLEGGHISSILQLTSFLLVCGAALGMSLLNSPWHQIVYSYTDALKGKTAPASVFRLVGRNFLNAGLLGAFVGFVQVVRYLRVPDQIGPALAISVVSLLYGFLGYLFFGLGFEASLANRNEGDKSVEFKKIVMPAALILVAVFGSLRFGLGPDRLGQFFNVSSIIVVVAGVLVVAAFIRRLSRDHLPYLANGALAAGVVGCIFNFIHVMENLDKPESIFIGLSVALLPMLYAVLISATLRSISDNMDGSTQSIAMPQRPQTLIPYYVATVGVLLVSTTLVMYAISLPQT